MGSQVWVRARCRRRQRQRELTDAQTQLAVAQMNLQANDKDVVAIDAQIREVQGY